MTSRLGRPPHPDVLTPAEWRVLDQIRAGHPNALEVIATHTYDEPLQWLTALE